MPITEAYARLLADLVSFVDRERLLALSFGDCLLDAAKVKPLTSILSSTSFSNLLVTCKEHLRHGAFFSRTNIMSRRGGSSSYHHFFMVEEG